LSTQAGRVAAASKWIGLGKPLAPLLGGLLATWLPLRVLIAISAVLLLLPALLLDRRPGVAEEPATA
jgi:hypothetical protein